MCHMLVFSWTFGDLWNQMNMTLFMDLLYLLTKFLTFFHGLGNFVANLRVTFLQNTRSAIFYVMPSVVF